MSRTDQVRQALRELGQASAREVADHLQVQSRAGVTAVGKAERDLLKGGEATSVQVDRGPMKYSLLPDLNRRPISKQAKLWQAMQIKSERGEVWRVTDLAMLAESNLDYAKRYVRYCVAQGRVERIHHTARNAAWYRLNPRQENQEAPAWNRRAEKRKHVGQAPPPAVLPASKEIPPSPPLEKGGDEDHRLQTGATKLDAALEDFGRALVDITGSIGRAWEIIREMKGELLAIEEQGHDEPGEPTEGHH